mgnify:CR=1 FL=1
MITKQEIEHFREIGSKEVILDPNKNPSTRSDFQYPKYVIDLEKKQIHLIAVSYTHLTLPTNYSV